MKVKLNDVQFTPSQYRDAGREADLTAADREDIMKVIAATDQVIVQWFYSAPKA